jgi:hypothetical protein
MLSAFNRQFVLSTKTKLNLLSSFSTITPSILKQNFREKLQTLEEEAHLGGGQRRIDS